jgi:hypothetical protein
VGHSMGGLSVSRVANAAAIEVAGEAWPAAATRGCGRGDRAGRHITRPGSGAAVIRPRGTVWWTRMREQWRGPYPSGAASGENQATPRGSSAPR